MNKLKILTPEETEKLTCEQLDLYIDNLHNWEDEEDERLRKLFNKMIAEEK